MTSEKMMIRPMSGADISRMIKIHFECFPDSRSTKLGEVFLRKMYRWYLLFQAELSIVATNDEEIVGFVTGSIGGSSRKIFRYAFLEIIWGFLCRPKLFLQPDMFEQWYSYFLGFFPKRRNAKSVGEATGFVKATLDSIAVSHRARGRKLGRILVNAFEDAARKQGTTILGLGVERDNVAARRLYESCGWKLARESVANNSANYTKEIKNL